MGGGGGGGELYLKLVEGNLSGKQQVTLSYIKFRYFNTVSVSQDGVRKKRYAWIRIIFGSWIRIRIKAMEIRNPAYCCA